MSIIVSGIRLSFEQDPHAAIELALKQCGLAKANDIKASIYRRSVDARRGKINMVYSVCIDGVADGQAFAEKLQMPSVRFKSDAPMEPAFGTKIMTHRPIVVGFGPAGLFAAYLLAKYGYQPIILERGESIEDRDASVKRFFDGGALNTQSNIQFGEGGAGTYSDGKLTTRINDPLCETVLRVLVEHGAPEEVLQQAKPHIGTDILKNVVRSMREQILSFGGNVHFRTALTGLKETDGKLIAAETDGQEIACEHVILAVGHSARDTFELLQGQVYMEPKAFSVGVRVEHLQTEIDRMLYGNHAGHPLLPAAEYTLSHRENERACYSFCMCPGGHVVAAQSEEASIVTNGMSYHARDGKNANSALVVSVAPQDFGVAGALDGIAFQRQIERAAYALTGSYRAPCQRVGDFMEGRNTKTFGSVQPTYPIGVEAGSIEQCLPNFVCENLRTGLRVFDRKMRGFLSDDALLTAPETRTSSPVRLTRGEDLFSASVKGLIPCGEGAGYAGGIMSAAVDGIRAALRIMQEYKPL